MRPAAALAAAAATPLTEAVPHGLARADTSYDWCDCGKGLSRVTAWPDGDRNRSVTVEAGTAASFNFTPPVAKIGWVCDGMSDEQTSSLAASSSWWTVRLTTEKKPGALDACGKVSGRVKWNTWRPADYATSIPFSSYEDGYACVKIPVLVRTHAGTLLAFGEGRKLNCSDFARTDLVVKRSTDGGKTWSAISRVGAPVDAAGGLCGNSLVVGNAAPVQLSASSAHHPGRILVPHMRNEYEAWSAHSDDDGVTWSPPRRIDGVTNVSPGGPDCGRNMSYFGIDGVMSVADWVEHLGWAAGRDPYTFWRKQLTGPWQFIGLGPPGALQLRGSGRILVPGYHSYIRGGVDTSGQGAGIGLPVSQLYNNFALGHVMISDDGGDTWRLASADGYGGGAGVGGNEAQLVQLRNGSVLTNSRTLSAGSPQLRAQAVSDDGGETFSPTYFVADLPEPFDGCLGSIVAARDGTLYYSHPLPAANRGIAPDILKLLGAGVNLTTRDHMTVWSSRDEGATYQVVQTIDVGAAGYSSLQMDGDDGLWVMYEQSDRAADSLSQLGLEALIGELTVLNPDRFVLRRLQLR